MKKWIYLLLLVVALFMTLITGVYAPVLALTYHDYYLHFPTYEVVDFEDKPIVINANTFNNVINGSFNIKMNIAFSSCPAPTKRFSLNNRIVIGDTRQNLPNLYLDINCSTNYQTIERTIIFDENNIDATLLALMKDAITSKNDTSIFFYFRLLDDYNQDIWQGVTITTRAHEFSTILKYEFNTTYYFDHLATDINIPMPLTKNWTISNYNNEADTNIGFLLYYNSTDYYRLWNTDYTLSTTRGRKKYYLPLSEKSIAYGIGLSSFAVLPYSPSTPSTSYTVLANDYGYIEFLNRIYLLNFANSQQAFPNADTLPVWEYDTCNAWDIPCHLGNALVYLAKDAPITSDIYQIASSGWQFISNGFYAVTSLFGANFDENGNLLSGNAFGVLLLISLGVLLISWGVSGDE